MPKGKDVLQRDDPACPDGLDVASMLEHVDKVLKAPLHSADFPKMKSYEPGVLRCSKEEIVRLATQHTTCTSCCNALRLMTKRALDEHRVLSLFVHEDDSCESYILDDKYAQEPLLLEKLFSVFPLQNFVTKIQPVGREKRCPLHSSSRHAHCDTDLWEVPMPSTP